MSAAERHEALAALLRETAKAHHTAFADTDGFDPEWPIWYAEHLQPRLRPFVNSDITVSRLVHTLVQLDDEHTARKPELAWPEFWATGIVDRLAN